MLVSGVQQSDSVIFFRLYSIMGYYKILNIIPSVCVCVCVCVHSVPQSCLTLLQPMDRKLPGSSVHEIFPGKNTGVDHHSLLQGIVTTQGLSSRLLHCGWILYHWTTCSIYIMSVGSRQIRTYGQPTCNQLWFIPFSSIHANFKKIVTKPIFCRTDARY